MEFLSPAPVGETVPHLSDTFSDSHTDGGGQHAVGLNDMDKI